MTTKKLTLKNQKKRIMIHLGMDCIFVLSTCYYVDNNKILTVKDTKIISVCIDRTSLHLLTGRLDPIILSTHVKTFHQGRQKQFSCRSQSFDGFSLRQPIIQNFQK